jgi:hypothetical protein
MPREPGKARVDQATDMRIHEDVLVRLLEDTMARMLRASAAPMPAAASFDHAQAIRSEVKDKTSEVKVEPMQLVNTMMGKNASRGGPASRRNASNFSANAQERTSDRR